MLYKKILFMKVLMLEDVIIYVRGQPYSAPKIVQHLWRILLWQPEIYIGKTSFCKCRGCFSGDGDLDSIDSFLKMIIV